MLVRGAINGHEAFWLENENLKVGVLPNKGADIFEFIYKPGGVEFLMRTPSGLLPPGSQPLTDFLTNYEGGWQELFPNPGDAYESQGVTLPFHGEVALLPWEYAIERDDEEETSVRLNVLCQHTPFKLERLMRLRQGLPALEITGTVTNLSAAPAYFCWGHHIVLGGNFLEAGCSLDVPARTIITPTEQYEPETARLAPGQSESWPYARGCGGDERFDLRRIPGPQAHCHDDVYLTGLEKGAVSVVNPRLGLRFWLDWDAQIFGCLVNWQPFGGADMPPLTGIYGVGIEPWVSRLGLAQAVEAGEALQLGPGDSLSTRLFAGVAATCPAC
jgi:galactose mutarotase-like enzyme